jgi:hypothetical protein
MRMFLVAFIGGIVGSIFTSALVIAWSGPASVPPNGNVSAPINVGAVDQVKNSGLALNALAVFGNSIMQAASYMNWGTVAGSGGYGIRDNGGVMEFRNSGGTWTPIASSTAASAQQLYNNVHMSTQCTSAGGLVRSTGSSSICEFTGTSCPAGWTRLNNWGSTNTNSCSNPDGGGVNGNGSCATGSHAFANTVTETCTYCGQVIYAMGSQQCVSTATCTANLVSVGCY